MSLEYAAVDEYGDVREWSCGCPRVFDTVRELEAWTLLNDEPYTTVVRESAGEWRKITHSNWRATTP